MAQIDIGGVMDDLGRTPAGWGAGLFPGNTEPTAVVDQFFAMNRVNAWRANFDVLAGASLSLLANSIATEVTNHGYLFGLALSRGIPVLFTNLISPQLILRSSTGEFRSAPLALYHYEHYGYYTAKALLSAMIAQGMNTDKALFTFKNEPESSVFTLMTLTALFASFSAYYHGVRRAGVELGIVTHVGGIGGHPPGSTESLGNGAFPEAMLLSFLRFCRNPPITDEYYPGIPIEIDFIDWHDYDFLKYPRGVAAVAARGYLQRTGFSPDLPQYITESTWWTTFSLKDAKRDDERGAANLLYVTHYNADAGVQGICQFRGVTGNIVFPTGFDGDFGIVKSAGGTLIRNGPYMAYEMLSQLGSRRISSFVSSSDENRGIHVMASAEDGDRAVIISRFQISDNGEGPGVGVEQLFFILNYLLGALGYGTNGAVNRQTDFSTGLTELEIINYINGTSSGQIVNGALPAHYSQFPSQAANPPPGRTLAQDLEEAKSAAAELYSFYLLSTNVTVKIANPELVTGWQRYRINSGVTNNPARAYLAAVGSGEAAAIAAAQAQNVSLTAEATGVDGSAFPMVLSLEPYDSVLFKIQAPYPIVDTDTGARWNPPWKHL